jgi:hypothetical protein
MKYASGRGIFSAANDEPEQAESGGQECMILRFRHGCGEGQSDLKHGKTSAALAIDKLERKIA